MRAARAAIVIPALLAITFKGIADTQMALFATFGGIATLVIANFGGKRKDKLIAHAGLAVVGSLSLTIGTLVSGTTWLAAVVSIPVAFAIFFAGVIGPNAASGTTAALFAYVLPVASAGGAGTIPSRLGGWWLASVTGTAAVLLFSPRTPGDRLRTAAATLAAELATRVRAAANGETTAPDTMRQASAALQAAFIASPYWPTGLATADQGLASVVQTLGWVCTQVGEAFDGHLDTTQARPVDRELLRAAGCLLHDVSALLAGQDAEPDFEALEAARTASTAHLRELSGRAGEPGTRVAAAHAVHAHAIAVAVRSTAADALIASGRADPETIATERRQWYGTADGAAAALGLVPGTIADSARLGGLAGATVAVARHTTIRSVWFLNSLRGAVALAVAVTVADLSGVQHGFWVVLGTLSVLRTNAAATGATAWRALAGTVVGFVVGAPLLLAIGTGHAALWAALPLAVLVAAYAPGTLPFLVGQAGFTVTVVVLFNLLVPVGWRVGLLRVEDVAIGCAVSLIVGVLFWPRGAGPVVSNDLADSFRRAAEYLTQAVNWALSEPMAPPSAAVAAIAAGVRLDDALRGFLAEQGSKRVSKEDLWALVNASTRLRLTANALAGLRRVEPGAPGGPDGLACPPLKGSGDYAGTPACATLQSAAAGLAGFYGQVADEVSRPRRSGAPTLIPAPAPVGPAIPPPNGAAQAPGSPGQADSLGSPGGAFSLSHPHLLWVKEHLHHLGQSARTVSEPALRVAEARQRPWWR
jgi:uncharacterized membrane protein YccC